MNFIEAKYNDLQSLDQFTDEKIGKKGTTKRDEFETRYEAFKLGVLIQQDEENKRLSN
ncbi:hypothetical protein [Flavobacterium ardleyense]|uniref:hypothetical protein n=1 Tax=Flavobacterium ardleyense TaxID=2038737 RepID=UPI00298D179F|nr:hypothetical protein [Flavobacterium ardleyense]